MIPKLENIPKPDDLDETFVARIHALLNALVMAEQGDIGLHENRGRPHLAYAVATWAAKARRQIETYVTTNGNGQAYEVWNIDLGSSALHRISVWPLTIGTLDSKDALRGKIEAIRQDADERIKQLLEVEQAKAVLP